MHRTKHISTVYNVAAFLYLPFMVNVCIFSKEKFCIYKLQLSAVCAQYPICLFAVIASFRAVTVLCSGNYEWLWGGSSSPNYYWCHFWFYIPQALFSIVRNLHYRTISSPFLITFLSPEIATLINIPTTNKQLLTLISHLLLAKSTRNRKNSRQCIE
jgi:uncharacterized membrane protein